MKSEFSKKLLYVDYAIFFVLLICAFVLRDYYDFGSVLIAWSAQLGVSQAAYYWKAKSENRVKVPIKVIESLPDDIRKELDMTEIITSIIQSE